MIQEPAFRKDLLALRAAIKGFSAESVILSKKKSKATKAVDKNGLAMEKLYLGWNTRAHILAYAFLRGKNYKQIEKTAKVWSDMERAKIFTICKLYAYWKMYYIKDEQCIKQWMEGQRFFLTTDEMNAKYLERQAMLAKRLEGQRQC